MKTGDIIDIAVYDGFQGKVKVIQNFYFKLLIEIIDVTMCYPQQVQLSAGERMWIRRKDIVK